MNPIFRFYVFLALLVVPLSLARASDMPSNVQRLVFVAGRDASSVTAVDVDRDSVVGTIELGIVPLQLRVSGAQAKLVAIDGKSFGVTIAEIASGAVRVLPFDFAPTRLLITADEGTVIAANDKAGEIALIDLSVMGEKARIKGPSDIRDLMVAKDGATIFIAADSIEGVSVYDALMGKLTSIIGTRPARALSRSLLGKSGFALSAGPDRFLTRFNLETAGYQETPTRGGAIYPMIARLLLPDPASGTIEIVPLEEPGEAVHLEAEPAISRAYSGYFDTVAFVPGAKTIFVYDMEKLAPSGRIAISGTAGPGVVTPETTKVYLPVESARELIAIDAASRAVGARIKLDFAPTLAEMAGAYGVCH
ncbi:hypothetical protein T281_04890 [Rhodomicrobium udaipurense JA643]|uniref:Uncharacterized protein n=1 Tax=Rhodomicrobium udaipurense TaxID=1202716 RepID=A0A8I1GGZ8_9HYPH|nr:hypothetical protein [Rhodomicrobium udaipurense]KAI95553.1 hypothetical protein T281_04890 [Rhodomicrobium udaipurense JA643]MBJ7542782.1 hypothetical protein [Rhodomicrobium udaipurense]